MLRVGAVVALVEEQVDGALYGWEARAHLGGVAHLEQRSTLAQRAPGAKELLLHRRLGGEESLRDLLHREAAQVLEDHRHLRGSGEPGIAAREHQPQLVVGDGVLARDAFRFRGGRLQGQHQLGGEVVEMDLPPEQVDGPVSRRAHEPGCRVLRRAPELPGLERANERVLHRILGERQVAHAEDADQGRHHPARLATEEVAGELEGLVAHIGRTGRTSTAPSFS